MDKQHRTLEKKMELAQKGDRVVYASLLRDITNITKGYLYKRIPYNDAEDVMQEILLSIHKARHTYDSSRPIKPWIMAIANYRLNDYLRRHYRKNINEVFNDEFIDNKADENVTETSDHNELLIKAVASLRDKQRKIVKMMKLEGYSAKEVAKKLGMKVPAVKVAAHRAYKKLKTRLEK